MSSRLAALVQSHGVRRVMAVLLALILQQSFGRWLVDRVKKMPPGPVPFPILGNFPLLSPPNTPPGLHRDFWRLAQQYGPIYTLRMGSNLGVVINSPELAFECMNEKQDETYRRPNLPSFYVLTHFQGVAMNNGPRWRAIRTLLQTTVTNKQLGLELGPMITEEVDASLFWLKQQCEAGHSSDFDLRQLCRRESLNMAMRRLFSFRFSTAMTPDYFNTQDAIRIIFEQIAQASPSDFMPIFKYFPDPVHDKFKAVCDDLVFTKLKNELERHKREVGKRQGKEMDFMDTLLVVQKQQEKDLKEWQTTTDPEIKAKPEPIVPTDEDIYVAAWDMMAGAIDTAATTMEWALYLLVNYPEVQTKVQAEVDRVVGAGRLPTVDDIPNLPYCTAVLDEIVRFKHFAPQGLPHEAEEDITLGGYNVPKGTQIFFNFFSLHMDPKNWNKPEEFRPERFLEEEKYLLDTILHSETHFKDKKSYKFIPFGQGRRRCVGYGIGRIQLFLKFTTWMQCFTWESPNGQPMDLDTEILGITMMPAEQKIKATPRPAAKVLKGELASGLLARVEAR